jgi:hypothetical protein
MDEMKTLRPRSPLQFVIGRSIVANLIERNIAFCKQLLKMAEAPVSKKRKRGNPNQKTGLIGVCMSGNKYMAQINYGGTNKESWFI